MIKETVYSTLTNDATVAALVGTRVYPHKPPQGATLPAVGYLRIGGPRDTSLNGASGSARTRIRFDCWATTSDGADAVMRAVRDAMDAYTGAFAAINPVEFHEEESDAYRVTIDYYIHHTEG